MFDDSGESSSSGRDLKPKHRQLKTVKRRKRWAKQIVGDWPDERIKRLIAAVEQRPELYKARTTTYRVRKDQVWKDVAAELGNADDWLDCRAKWQGLRVTFRVNLMKQRRSQLETDELVKINWRFFNSMRFIENNETTESTSNLMHDYDENGDDDDDLNDSPAPSNHGKRQKLASSSPAVKIQAPPPQPAPAENLSLKEMAERAMELCVAHDTHSIYGDYVADELRRLPAEDVFQLRLRISRTIVNFLEERELKENRRYQFINDNTIVCDMHHEPEHILKIERN